jgi:hypothetical protein
MAPLPVRAFRLLLVLLTTVAVGACTSSSKTGRKAVHPVRGKVLYKDKPPAGAFVVFVPATEPPQPVDPRPRATVQAVGTIQLFTNEADDGAAAGV